MGCTRLFCIFRPWPRYAVLEAQKHHTAPHYQKAYFYLFKFSSLHVGSVVALKFSCRQINHWTTRKVLRCAFLYSVVPCRYFKSGCIECGICMAAGFHAGALPFVPAEFVSPGTLWPVKCFFLGGGWGQGGFVCISACDFNLLGKHFFRFCWISRGFFVSVFSFISFYQSLYLEKG